MREINFGKIHGKITLLSNLQSIFNDFGHVFKNRLHLKVASKIESIAIELKTIGVIQSGLSLYGQESFLGKSLISFYIVNIISSYDGDI